MGLMGEDYSVLPCFVDLITAFVSTLADGEFVLARVELDKGLYGTRARGVRRRGVIVE